MNELFKLCMVLEDILEKMPPYSPGSFNDQDNKNSTFYPFLNKNRTKYDVASLLDQSSGMIADGEAMSLSYAFNQKRNHLVDFSSLSDSELTEAISILNKHLKAVGLQLSS